MSDESRGRTIFAYAVLAVAIGLGVVIGIAGRGQPDHHVAGGGKYAAVVWAVAEIIWHPAIGIPLLLVVVGLMYLLWQRQQQAASQRRCEKCQHVQVMPADQSTFACELCGAPLKQRTRDKTH
jgi:hypothetical protein